MSSDPPSRLDELSEIEKRFKVEFEKYCGYIISLNNILINRQKQSELRFEDFLNNRNVYLSKINSWGFDATSQFNLNFPIYNNLTSRRPPSLYKREDIEERTKQLSSHMNSLLLGIFGILAHIIRENYSSLNLQVQQFRQNGNLFSGSAAQIRNTLQTYGHYVIFKSDYSRQIILFQNQLNILKDIKKIIDEKR